MKASNIVIKDIEKYSKWVNVQLANLGYLTLNWHWNNLSICNGETFHVSDEHILCNPPGYLIIEDYASGLADSINLFIELARWDDSTDLDQWFYSPGIDGSGDRLPNAFVKCKGHSSLEDYGKLVANSPNTYKRKYWHRANPHEIAEAYCNGEINFYNLQGMKPNIPPITDPNEPPYRDLWYNFKL